MKNIVKIMAITAASAMTACSTNDGPKALVLYYSQTGTTKAVAEEIAAQTGADIEAFDVATPYEGTFEETIARCLEERQNGFVPESNPLTSDLSEYDVIFLGYPIWFGTYAPPVKALLDVVALDGKTIVPFCTFGSGGLDSGIADLKSALPNSEIREGYGVRTARIASMPDEVNRFLVENGYKEGEIEKLPEFGEQQPVTAEEAEIFNQACSSYTFPLGTPVTVGSRKIPTGMEYLFTAESQSPDGRVGSSRIYVIAEEGKAPEFTQVVR